MDSKLELRGRTGVITIDADLGQIFLSKHDGGSVIALTLGGDTYGPKIELFSGRPGGNGTLRLTYDQQNQPVLTACHKGEWYTSPLSEVLEHFTLPDLDDSPASPELAQTH